MRTIFVSVILNLLASLHASRRCGRSGFHDLNVKKTRCRTKFGMTRSTIRGFTLIELLVAMSIIGILSAFLMANFVGVRQRARDGVRKSDLRQIQSALELYRSDHGNYPASSLPSCGLPLQDSSTPPVVYMQKIPCDPSSTTSNLIFYTYSSSPSGNTTYSLIACLENANDSQKDSSVASACTSTTNISYTLQNP